MNKNNEVVERLELSHEEIKSINILKENQVACMSLDSDDSHQDVKSINHLHHECNCLKKQSKQVFMNQDLKKKISENL